MVLSRAMASLDHHLSDRAITFSKQTYLINYYLQSVLMEGQGQATE